jgi:hypothetical protein
MKVEIINRFTPDGREFYEWSLWDGPDGIEEVHGYAVDLITAFSKVLEWHERIASDYANNIVSEIETARHFITTNDPNNEPTN